eukprot:6186739-Pleurochrysis_carterae.AAC.2
MGPQLLICNIRIPQREERKQGMDAIDYEQSVRGTLSPARHHGAERNERHLKWMEQWKSWTNM